jgi:small subunit ribosomal protein S2
MNRYIYGKRNLIHIINLVETVKGLTRAVGFLKNISATGQQVVFVGTKRQIKNIVETESRRCIMPWVTERWLGGTLTNFQTIRARLKRLEQLEELESTGKLTMYSKKIQASLMRELRKIKKNLDGIREMHRLPGAVVVVDPKNENITVKEANKLGIPVIAILDTDCDPDEVDICVPGNDDAIRSVQILLERMVDAVNEGKANYNEQAAMEARAAEAEDEFELASERRGVEEVRGGEGPADPSHAPGILPRQRTLPQVSRLLLRRVPRLPRQRLLRQRKKQPLLLLKLLLSLLPKPPSPRLLLRLLLPRRPRRPPSRKHQLPRHRLRLPSPSLPKRPHPRRSPRPKSLLQPRKRPRHRKQPRQPRNPKPRERKRSPLKAALAG